MLKNWTIIATLIAIGLLSAALVAYGQVQYSKGFTAGADSFAKEVTEATRHAVKVETQRIRVKLSGAVERSNRQRDRALTMVAELQKRQDEVTTNEIIETTNSDPNCGDLGPSFVQIYNRLQGYSGPGIPSDRNGSGGSG